MFCPKNVRNSELEPLKTGFRGTKHKVNRRESSALNGDLCRPPESYQTQGMQAQFLLTDGHEVIVVQNLVDLVLGIDDGATSGLADFRHTLVFVCHVCRLGLDLRGKEDVAEKETSMGQTNISG